MIYDLIIIGGGPAGYVGAERAGNAGLKTLLIEKDTLGGVCLNEGCIPSKALLYSAKLYDGAKYGDKYGVTSTELTYDQATVIKRKGKIVKTLISGIKAKMKKNNVTVVKGMGIIDGRDGENFKVKVGDEEYAGRRLLIATGSIPVIPPISGLQDALKQGYALTNKEMLDLENVPASLTVIGGGVIGLEMASYYNSVGSDVIVVELLDHIAGETDRDISNLLKDAYEKKGVKFILEAKVVEVNENKVVYEKDGDQFTLESDKTLLSVGRKPVSDNIGLDTVGVETERSAVKVDDHGMTNIVNIYAAGDVNGRSMLAHTAYREAEVCINHMLGIDDRMRYDTVPMVIYTNPEVASIGETVKTADDKGISYKVTQISMRYSGRYLAENQGGNGICKLIVENDSEKLIGVHMIANYASEIIYGVSAMIEAGFTVDQIKRVVFPHPTVSEIIREGIFEV